jgi:hypothetical protein
MPFSPTVKARIFVKCARICCLCFKQCGARIEAAHIVAEADGGSNDDENAIPVCFDCHEEIGSYNLRHPKGNKFTEIELRERRDALYSLVDRGVIQAQIVAHRLERIQVARGSESATETARNEAIATPYVPSREAQAVLDDVKKPFSAVETLPRKLELLEARDRAYVVDGLIESFLDDLGSAALMLFLDRSGDKEESLVVLERLLRIITLRGDATSRARFMVLVPLDLFKKADERLRVAFFEEVIATMLRDQYTEVNQITPAAVKVQQAIPTICRESYVSALLDQARSGAWQGAPAARTGLVELPHEFTAAAFHLLDAKTLYQHALKKEHIDAFLEKYRSEWPSDRALMYEEYLQLDPLTFGSKFLGRGD